MTLKKTNKTFLSRTKRLVRSVFTLLILTLIYNCTTDDKSNKDDDVSLDSRFTYNFNFEEKDNQYKSIVEEYLKSYEFTVNSNDWKYDNIYKLNRFHLVLFDMVSNNVDAMYMVVPGESNYTGDVSDVLATSFSPSDDAKVIRLKDKELVDRMLSGVHPNQSFSKYSENGIDYLFIIDRGPDDSITFPTMESLIGYYMHEGYHLFPQKNFLVPDRIEGFGRFQIPEDYPADNVSFSLIAAGYQLFENLLFEDNIDYEAYMKMNYVLFKKLRELDTTGKGYIDGYYLYFAAIEGSAQFMETAINLGSGVLDKEDDLIRSSMSYQGFIDGIQEDIDENNTTLIINGVVTESRYGTLLLSFYKLGANVLFILDHLGVDVMAENSAGKNPYEMLQEYIDTNNITINEEEVLDDLKSEIDWNTTMELMEDYIKLWK